jgi:hypothetical protein
VFKDIRELSNIAGRMQEGILFSTIYPSVRDVVPQKLAKYLVMGRINAKEYA